MTIKILGSGSPGSQQMEENVKYALRQLNRTADDVEMIRNKKGRFQNEVESN